MTSSQLCIVSSSVDVSTESASFAEILHKSFTSLVQPYRYTSYDTPSSLRLTTRPTTMLFGCPLPDDLDGVTRGERAVANAFETILISAVKMHPLSLYQAICDAHKQQGDDIKLVKYLFMCPSAMFAHVTVRSQHSNWNYYGTHVSQMVVRELLITWQKHAAMVF